MALERKRSSNTDWINDELNNAVRQYKDTLDARDASHTDEPDKKMVPMRTVQSTFATKIRKQPVIDLETDEDHLGEFENPRRRIGACCKPDTTCELMTQADCEDIGGVYAGDRTDCAYVNCAPSCPELTLACDSITASKSKCGFTEYGTPSTPPKRYLREDYSLTESGSNFNDASLLTTTLASDKTSYTEYVSCSPSTHCSYTTGYRVDEHDGSTGFDNYTIYNPCTGAVITNFPALHGQAVWGSACGSPGINGITTIAGPTSKSRSSSNSTGGGPHDHCSYSASESWALSVEYTTADLISNTIAALPSYSGTFGCGGSHTAGQGCLCTSFRNLSTDELSYTIRRFKHKFLFTAPAAGVEFDITWCEKFTPEGGGSPTYDDKTWHYADTGDDDSDEFEVMEPAADGTTEICCIRCCLTAVDGVAAEDLPACDEATCP